MGKTFRLVHIYISLFFLPLALLYAVSGVLFLCGFNQDSYADKKSFYIDSPFDSKKLSAQVQELLEQNNLKLPSSFEAKKAKGGGVMYGTASYSVVAKQKGQGVSVEVTQRSVIGLAMLLHKGKAKWYFDVLAYGFALALVALYVSGLIIANLNKIKGKAWATVGIGFLAVLVLGYLSVI